MAPHPVTLTVQAAPLRRSELALRVLVFVAIGAAGCSTAHAVLYFALPFAVALLIHRDDPGEYLRTDGPVLVRALRWMAAAYAYLWLLTDAAPTSNDGGAVDLEVEMNGRPTAASALKRVATSLPALLVLVVFAVAAALLWFVGAVVVLATGKLPGAIRTFLEGVLCYQMRLAAYHLSLVETYPSLAARASTRGHAKPAGGMP